ncbi:hypothetical protein EDD11_004781 [Mortierella claussenii]|nr:hypothetical protein EDD11_004781 [Mortierella claussenii]
MGPLLHATDDIFVQQRPKKKRKNGSRKADASAAAVHLVEALETRLPNAQDRTEHACIQANILKQMETLRRNRFFAESASDKDQLQDGFRMETSMWNTAMANSIVQIAQEAIHMLVSLTKGTDQIVVQKTYVQSMNVVQEHLLAPLLTFHQHHLKRIGKRRLS